MLVGQAVAELEHEAFMSSDLTCIGRVRCSSPSAHVLLVQVAIQQMRPSPFATVLEVAAADR